MTQTSLLPEIRSIVTNVAVPYHEPPSVVRRRRIGVTVLLVIGAVLLGFSLSTEPGDESFYWLTLALAAVWGLGSLATGPLHLGCVRFRGRNQRPVITGTVAGLLLGGVFVVGALVVREIPVIADYVAKVLAYADYGALWLVVLITLVNGVAEELFFRGALYTALENHYPAIISTVVYVIAMLVSTQNPMLGFAALVLGVVCAYERRITGGVLAPVLTHLFWGLVMVLALPPMFGI